MNDSTRLRNADNVGRLSSEMTIFLEDLSEHENAAIQLSLISGDVEAVEFVPDEAPMRIENVVSLSNLP